MARIHFLQHPVESVRPIPAPPTSFISSARLHPLTAAAAVSVITVSLVGVGVMTGVLPDVRAAHVAAVPVKTVFDAPSADKTGRRMAAPTTTMTTTAPAVASTLGIASESHLAVVVPAVKSVPVVADAAAAPAAVSATSPAPLATPHVTNTPVVVVPSRPGAPLISRVPAAEALAPGETLVGSSTLPAASPLHAASAAQPTALTLKSSKTSAGATSQSVVAAAPPESHTTPVRARTASPAAVAVVVPRVASVSRRARDNEAVSSLAADTTRSRRSVLSGASGSGYGNAGAGNSVATASMAPDGYARTVTRPADGNGSLAWSQASVDGRSQSGSAVSIRERAAQTLPAPKITPVLRPPIPLEAQAGGDPGRAEGNANPNPYPPVTGPVNAPGAAGNAYPAPVYAGNVGQSNGYRGGTYQGDGYQGNRYQPGAGNGGQVRSLGSTVGEGIDRTLAVLAGVIGVHRQPAPPVQDFPLDQSRYQSREPQRDQPYANGAYER